MKTIVDTTNFVKEFKADCFDSLCNIALGNMNPSYTNGQECVHSDIFVCATKEEQDSALKLFVEVTLFKAEEFKLFMEEACDTPFGDQLLLLDQDIKLEFFDFFSTHYKVKTLSLFIRNEDFNPLYFTDYAEGLAIRFIQNPAEFREKVLHCISQIFRATGMDFSGFLTLPFGEQESYYSQFCEEFIIQSQQALDCEFISPPLPAPM